MRNARLLASVALAFVAVAAFADVPGTLAPTVEFALIDGTMVPFQSGTPLIDFEPQDHPAINLAGPWKKERFHADHDLSLTARDVGGIAALEVESEGRQLPGYPDAGWDVHVLPGVEAAMPGDETAPPEAYHDGVWYRRAIEIPAVWAGRATRLVCLGADYTFDLWINGVWVGVHEGGYTPFAFDVTDFLDYGDVNYFAIRVDGLFPGARQDAVPAWPLADWWTYAGVVQDLYLESAPAIEIVRASVVPTDYNGRIAVQVVVRNRTGEDRDLAVAVAAFHADRNAPGYLNDPRASSIVGQPADLGGETETPLAVAAGETRVASFAVKVRRPLRWTPKEPNLYVLRVTLADGESVTDVHHVQFGVRTVGTAGGQLLVNGRVAFLPGVARHEEWPDSGRTATWAKIRGDLEEILDLNALLLRTGHYPNHVYTYLLTDRLGLAAYVEIPVYWFFGWNWKHQAARRIADQMFREMALSGANRPSVLLWGTSNESVFLWASDIRDYNRRLRDDLHANFPDGRLVTQSPAADPTTWKPMAKSEETVDVAGWTTYYGVFYGEDAYAETRDWIGLHREAFPDLPIVSTEFGSWASSEEEYPEQVATATETFRAFAETAALARDGTVNEGGAVAGCIWFTAFDWYTKNGLPEFVAPYLQSMGLIHMDRVTWKPAAFALSDAYAPYRRMGGLGPEPADYADDDDDDNEDDAGGDDDEDGGGCGGN
jgi:beta-glucuronidase